LSGDDPVGRLRAAGVDNPRLDARVLKERVDDFGAALDRRIAREPVAYITGHKEFWSLDFEVGPGALVPRPETETLIEELLKAFPDKAVPLEILDLGSGSGCLLIAACHEYPSARGEGIDSAPDALFWTMRNLARHGMDGRARAELMDWADLSGAWDVILCNPPYIPTADVAGLAPEVRLYEPLAALDGGVDGLEAYRALAPRIAKLLKPLGRGFLEIGAGQETEIAPILNAAGLKIVCEAKDLAGIVRCIQVGL
jgi:release factor glutamine methyltransferase